MEFEKKLIFGDTLFWEWVMDLILNEMNKNVQIVNKITRLFSLIYWLREYGYSLLWMPNICHCYYS